MPDSDLGPNNDVEALDDDGQTTSERAGESLQTAIQIEIDTMIVADDGTGAYLVLAGPGAGSTHLDTAPTDATTLPAMPAPGAVLTDGRPILIVHREGRGAGSVPHTLGHAYAAGMGDVILGACVALHRRTPAANTQALADAHAASLKIADPSGYLAQRADLTLRPIGEQAAQWAPYLTTGAKDIAAVLDAQRNVGANLLLTSGRALDPTSPDAALQNLTDEGDDALSRLTSGEQIALNITVSSIWLTSDNLRHLLRETILEADQFSTIWLRVQINEPTRRSGEQPSTEALLLGYRDIAYLADEEERNLLLPNTGTTGWLLANLGARGFGTGIDNSAQIFNTSRLQDGGARALDRYFEPTLLHAVEEADHRRLETTPGYQPCPCVYCRAQRATAGWDADLAGQHHVVAHAQLTHEAASSGGRTYARKRVRAAQAAVTSAGLTGPAAPKHLPIWGRLL